MSDLQELYQELILEHNKSPRNFRVLENASHQAEGYNPLCGDRIKLYLFMEGDVIKDIGFQGAGCAIFKASSSLMTSSVKGLKKPAAQDLFEKFRKFLVGELTADPVKRELGKLAAFNGVSEFPVRVKCASLAWHTLAAAMEQSGKTVSTE